jgi:histidinol-phosphate aminotransferase
MRDRLYKNNCADLIKESRAQLAIELQQLGFKVGESHGNFLLATLLDGRAEQLYLGLKERGILVRYFNRSGLQDKLRITVGTPAQNHLLIQALAELLRI